MPTCASLSAVIRPTWARANGLRLGIDRCSGASPNPRHLVDIVNQTIWSTHRTRRSSCAAHGPLTLSVKGAAGVLPDLLIIGRRTFRGRAGRLRPCCESTTTSRPTRAAPGNGISIFAARYSHTFGPLDLGLSVFDGTSGNRSCGSSRSVFTNFVLGRTTNRSGSSASTPQLTVEALAASNWKPSPQWRQQCHRQEGSLCFLRRRRRIHLQRHLRIGRRPQPARRMDARRAAPTGDQPVSERPVPRRAPRTQRRPGRGIHRRSAARSGLSHPDPEHRVQPAAQRLRLSEGRGGPSAPGRQADTIVHQTRRDSFVAVNLTYNF